MIHNTVINGRRATIAYLSAADWSLVDKDVADLAKVIFEDGEVLFLTPAGKTTAADAWGDEGNPYHRGGGKHGGEFTSVGKAGMAGERGVEKHPTKAHAEKTPTKRTGAAAERAKGIKRGQAKAAHQESHKKLLEHKEHLPEAHNRAAYHAALKRGPAGNHPGKGYSAGAALDEHGIIHTDDVSDVARALYEGKNVTLISPDKVSVAIDHLGKVASRMAAGGYTGTFDLCKVTLEGSSLFCVESKGIPRVKMPQLKGKPLPGSPASKMQADEKGEVDLAPGFRDRIEELGWTIEDTDERADHLKATQNELNGLKVAKLAAAMRKGVVPEERLFVSQDNYIIDGHHRWAAKVAIDYDDGKTGDVLQPVARVDAGIVELLAASLKYAEDMGLPQQGVGAIAQHPLVTNEKPKPIKGTKKGSHESKISPSVTSTEKAKRNSEDEYVATGARSMQADEPDEWTAEDKANVAKFVTGAEKDKGNTITPYHFNLLLHMNPLAYPGLRRGEIDPETHSMHEVERTIIDRMKDNLRFIWNHSTDEDKKSVEWYKSANELIKSYAKKYKLSDAAVAGVFAALSPQKDWDMNIYLAESVLNIYHGQANTAWTAEMGDKYQELFIDSTQVKIDQYVADGNQKKVDEYQGYKDEYEAKRDKWIAEGTTLGSLKDTTETSEWIRTYEETYGDPSQPMRVIDPKTGERSTYEHEHAFRAFQPDGSKGDWHTNKPKNKAEVENPVRSKAGWQTVDAINNAVMSMQSGGDRHKISIAMGNVHKVRNFYNNLVDPFGRDGDVTIDSHAIGAAWLRAQPTNAKGHGLATGPSADERPAGWEAARDNAGAGTYGTYGLYADAYRELADELGILPDELQAVLWVAKRNAFVDMFDDNIGKSDDEWRLFNEGKQELAITQEKVWAISQADRKEHAFLKSIGMTRAQYKKSLEVQARRVQREAERATKAAAKAAEKLAKAQAKAAAKAAKGMK